jgi:hypothetical protein
MSGLEAGWQWVNMLSVLGMVSVLPMSMLTFGNHNYLDTLAHPIRKFFNMERRTSSKRLPFTIPTWVLILTFVATMASLWVGASLIHANHGAYNGWVVNLNQITLLLIVASFALGNSWWPSYLLSSDACIPGTMLPIVVSIIAGISAEIKYSQFNVGWSFFLLPWNAYMTFLGIWVFFQERDCMKKARKGKNESA